LGAAEGKEGKEKEGKGMGKGKKVMEWEEKERVRGQMKGGEEKGEGKRGP